MSNFGTSANDPIMQSRLEQLITNVTSLRSNFLKSLLDPRRNIDDECGYPATENLTPEQYKDLYDREPVATRVVNLMPSESWKVYPDVYEVEDSETATDFEQAWDDLGKGLRGKSWFQDQEGNPVFEHLRRVDELSGIGSFGVLLLGIDDKKPLSDPVVEVVRHYEELGNAPEEPLNLGTAAQYDLTDVSIAEGKQQPQNDSETTSTVSTTRKLLYLREFDESLAQVTQWESNPKNIRYGQPVMYQLTLNDPKDGQHSGMGPTTSTVNVHWTRVIHVADNLGSSEVFGVPRMRPVLNPVLDIRKVRGGSAEMYWKGAFPGLSLETHPQLGGDVDIDQDQLRDDMENYQNGLQRYLTLMGMGAKTLAPQVVDPTPQINMQIDSICIQLGVPVRIFRGSERGELASSQDKDQWSNVVHGRRINHCTPHILVPFIDRLIQMQVLPEPEGYSAKWPDPSIPTMLEKADLAVKQTQSLAAYVSGQVESLISPLDFLTIVLGMEDEQAQAIIETTQEAIQDSTETSSNSPLLSMVGGITGMNEMFKTYKEQGISRDTLKRQLMIFFKLSTDEAEQLIADSEPSVPEAKPSFQKIRESETLVDQDGQPVASAPKKETV